MEKILLGGICILSIIYFFGKQNKGKKIPSIRTIRTHERLSFIRDNIKIFKPFAYDRLSGILFVSDYECLKKIFGQRAGSNRISTERITFDEELREKDYDMFEKPTQILNMQKGTNTGIATGDYDEEHKILRQRLHQTFSKLAGKDKVKEIIESNIQQIFIEIDLVMKENKTLDPGDIFMHASMNISTGMMFGQTHNFHDKEFKYLSSLIKKTFAEIKQNVIARVIVNCFPKMFISNGLFRKIMHKLFPTFDRMGDNVYRNFYPYIISKIKEHQEDYDAENPRDYLDFLIAATESNKKIGWHSLIFTTFSVYLAGSDTISTTMRWIMVSISRNPEVQQKCQKEIDDAIQQHGAATAENCPYFSAVLLECQRIYPAGETILHRTSEDLEINGYFIKKGTFVSGFLAAIMRDEANFPEPEIFRPERFLHDGVFKFDPKVCNFSTGLRNCPGMALSRTVLFQFTVSLLLKYNISTINSAKDIEIHESHSGMMCPKTLELTFARRK